MKKMYILRDPRKSNFFRPENQISSEEYKASIQNDEHFTWFENTKHGIEILRTQNFKKNNRAYLNYAYDEQGGYTHLLLSQNGYIHVVFERDPQEKDLKDLKVFAKYLNADLWDYESYSIVMEIV